MDLLTRGRSQSENVMSKSFIVPLKLRSAYIYAASKWTLSADRKIFKTQRRFALTSDPGQLSTEATRLNMHQIC